MQTKYSQKYVIEVSQKAVDKWGSWMRVESVIPFKGIRFKDWVVNGVVRSKHLQAFEWLKDHV